MGRPRPTEEYSELQRARGGDLAAFRHLVERHQGLVYASALRLTGGQRADALELAQEVFLRLHAALPRITSPEHLMHWLSRVVLQRGQAGTASDSLPADPGADFSARVVARVELRWSHRRRRSITGVSHSDPDRGLARLVLPAGLAAATILLLVLTLWWTGVLRHTAVADGSRPAPAAATDPPDSAPETPALARTPPEARPAAGQSVHSASRRDPDLRYSVIALPPRHQARDGGARSSLDAFYTALLVELRGVPGISVLIPGVTAPPTAIDQLADYLLTVTSLDAAAPVSGGLSFRVTDAWAGNGAAAGGLPSAGIATLQGRNSLALWPVEIRAQPIRQSDGPSFTSILRVGADDAQLAAQQVELLRQKVFPDALSKLQLLARMRDGSRPAAERSAALDDLLGAGRPDGGDGLTSAGIAAILEQSIAMRADQRAQLWRSLRRITHADLVEPLLDSARRDADENVRFEALATLAAGYGNDPQVRAAIEAVSRDDQEPLIRMAATRALRGEGDWRSYVIATLRDTRLTYAERLLPLVMAVNSAVTPAEFRDIRTMLDDPQVRDPLMGLVRDGWYETVEAGVIADAVGLLADAARPAASDLFVQVLPELNPQRPEAAPRVVKPAPQLSPEAMAWLLNHRNDPRVRRILQDVADGKVDQQLVATVEQLRKYEAVRPRSQRRP